MDKIDRQTKLESLIESIANQIIGIFTALLTWMYIVQPILMLLGFMNEKYPFWVNLIVTSIFTVISVLRSYAVRRFFNAGLHKVVHRAVSLYLEKVK